jgi:pyruvate ferredoxin oxidoreductase alpha subunit
VQDVYDLVLAAYRVAEDARVHLPALVCYDGFILSHASERVDPLTQEQVDSFLRPPGVIDRPVLDPEHPQQFGEVLFPDYYPDFEYKKHRALTEAIEVIDEAFAEYAKLSGRRHRVVEPFGTEDAETVFVGLGSMMRTVRHTVQQLRADGRKVGLIDLRVFRPFPAQALRDALGDARTVIVLDRDIGYGSAGMVFSDVTRTLYHVGSRPRVANCIVGLGGKEVTPATVEKCLDVVDADPDATVLWPDARGPKEGIPFTPGLAPPGRV